MSELAHFTKIDTLIEYILPHMQLRASNLENLNDPLENKWDIDRFLTYQSFDEADAPQEYSKYYLNEQKKLAQHFKIACFSHINHHLNDSDTISIPQENLRMWAEYGEKHAGTCIIFNKESLIYKVRQQIGEWISDHDVLYSNKENRHVSYTSHNVSEYLQGDRKIEDFFHENTKEMARSFPYQLFTKRNDWRDEREYRIVFYSANSQFHFFDIRDTIEKVYLGLKCDPTIAEEIRHHIPECKISKLQLKNLKLSEISL